MNKKIILIAVSLLALGAIGIAATRMKTPKPQPVIATGGVASPPSGYVITGRLLVRSGGKDDVQAFYLRQGDHRGWRLDQFYVGDDGRFAKQVRQWCVVGKGAFVERMNGAVEKVGPCNLYPANYGGAPTGISLEEATVKDHRQRDEMTMELTIAPRLGVQLHSKQKFTKNGAAYELIDESLTISYQTPPKDFLNVPD